MGRLSQLVTKSRSIFSCRGCFLSSIVALVVLTVVVFADLLLLGFRYDLWLTQNEELLEGFSTGSAVNENESAVRHDLDDNLERFKNSDIQKEMMWLSCEQVNLVFLDVIEDSWSEFRVESVGVVCNNRSLHIYLEVMDNSWFVVKMWQRAEGSVDFVVYDVMFGPYSLGDLTFGYISEEFSRGVNDAQSLVSEGGFSGRRVEEFDIEEGGIRVVGVLDDDAE